MASISNSNGRRTIQFVCADGKRRSIRLGQTDGRTAEGVKLHIERLIESQFANMPLHADTAAWLRGINHTLHDRISRTGLCPPRLTAARGQMPLRTMLDNYIGRRTDLKDGSLKMLKQTRDKLVEFFGEEKPIGSITAADAADFKRARRLNNAEGYVAKQVSIARQFFKDSVERELLVSNPFAKIRPGSQKNPTRQRFIAREVIDKAIEAAADIEWKLIIAFARYGGVRVPSEILSLEWCHIRWDEGRITIIASKTEHHVGHEQREIPIFPELRPLLEQARKLAAPGAKFVITRYRSHAANLRTQFMRILRAAKIEPWPKLFQNLRSTRQTELTEQFPAHVVCSWLGNSEKVAQGHYLQVTPAHFERAAAGLSAIGNNRQSKPDSGAENGGCSAASGGAACAGLASQDAAQSSEPSLVSEATAAPCDIVQVPAVVCKDVDMGAVGFEPTKAYANGFTARPFWPLRYTPGTPRDFARGDRWGIIAAGGGTFNAPTPRGTACRPQALPALLRPAKINLEIRRTRAHAVHYDLVRHLRRQRLREPLALAHHLPVLIEEGHPIIHVQFLARLRADRDRHIQDAVLIAGNLRLAHGRRMLQVVTGEVNLLWHIRVQPPFRRGSHAASRRQEPRQRHDHPALAHVHHLC